MPPAIKSPAAPALSPNDAAPGRLVALDVARGLTVLWMVAYHLVWDLTFFGVVEIDLLGDFVWWVQPQIITSLFLTWVGLSLALATAGGLAVGRYLRRTGWIALAALVITAATAVGFPYSYIFFGILHCITLASLIGLVVRRWPGWALVVVGGLFALLPRLDLPVVFDHPWLIWLGLGDRVPLANDFVPLMPYAAPMFLGLLLGRWLAGGAAADRLAAWRPGVVAWLGRHSLAVYLIHQPILLGGFYALHYGWGLFQPDLTNIVG